MNEKYFLNFIFIKNDAKFRQIIFRQIRTHGEGSGNVTGSFLVTFQKFLPSRLIGR